MAACSTTLTNRINHQWTTPLPVADRTHSPSPVPFIPPLYLCWLFCLRTRHMSIWCYSRMTIHPGLDLPYIKRSSETHSGENDRPFRSKIFLTGSCKKQFPDQISTTDNENEFVSNKTGDMWLELARGTINESIITIARYNFPLITFTELHWLTTGNMEHLQAHYNI